MSNIPKYKRIRDAVRRAIELREYAPDERLPSDAELAVRFETSRLTVIRALRDLEASGSVRRKAGSGTFVVGQPSSAARAFGILMPDLGDGEVFEPISQGIARAGESVHQTLLWGDNSASGRDKEANALELCRYFIARKVAGVFFAPVELSENQADVNRRISADLDAAGIRVVLIDRCIFPFPERCRYDLVGIDNRRAGYRMTRHLIHAGCRKIAFAYRAGSAPTVPARLAGYREALGKAGVSFESDGTDEAATRKFMASVKPDGIVCANDLTAAKLMHHLLNLGRRVPRDVRMAGINDVKYARFLPVPLTTLHQPCQQIGSAAMSAMLERLERPEMPTRDILLDCEMVVRQSCGGAAPLRA